MRSPNSSGVVSVARLPPYLPVPVRSGGGRTQLHLYCGTSFVLCDKVCDRHDTRVRGSRMRIDEAGTHETSRIGAGSHRDRESGCDITKTYPALPHIPYDNVA
jgi:hypothetical protein